MAIMKFIGTSSEEIQTRRGEIKPGIRLFYITGLKNGRGCYGASKLIAADRIADIGMPKLGVCYDVGFNQWGNIDNLSEMKDDPIGDLISDVF